MHITRLLAAPLLLAAAASSAQVLLDSIPYPGLGTGVWGIHVTADTIFLGSDFTGNIRFSDHGGTILSEQATGLDFNHGFVRRPGSYLIAEDYTTNGAHLYEVSNAGALLNTWTFPDVIGGPSSGIGDLEADGNALWYTMYYPDFNTYPFAYAYKWVPGDPAPIDTVPLWGEQPYGIALKGDTLFYVTDNLNGDQERIYGYHLGTSQDLGWVGLPDTPIDNDQRPQGMHYDGDYLYLVANRQGNNVNAYQTVFIYDFDTSVGFAEAQPEEELSLGPNPASDFLTVRSTVIGTYTIVDTQGRTVGTGQLNGRTMVDVRTLPPGSYVIRTTNVNGGAVQKFVVQR